MITRAKSKKLQQERILTEQMNKNQNQNAKVVDKLEAVLFEDFHLFQGENHVEIEGLRYQDIEKNQKQKQYLLSLRANLPKHSTLTSQQKVFHFKKISQDYEQSFQQKSSHSKSAKPKKLVSFQEEERYVGNFYFNTAFDKKDSPGRVKFLEESYDLTKF